MSPLNVILASLLSIFGEIRQGYMTYIFNVSTSCHHSKKTQNAIILIACNARKAAPSTIVCTIMPITNNLLFNKNLFMEKFASFY